MSRAATARLFVAVDPPASVRAELVAWGRGALGTGKGAARGASRPVRVLDPELLHVTLCFLGGRPVEEIESIGVALRDGAMAVEELSLGAPLWLPPRRPRALAVELHDANGSLARLQQSVSDAIQGATGWAPQELGGRRGSGRHRSFRPHITVARMRDGAAPGARELPPTPALAFTPTEVVLYRSWLAPEGASYEALASATLVPPLVS